MMIGFRLALAAFLFGFSLGGSVEAQDCPGGQCSTAASYAARMNAGRFFRHDRTWAGAEVIYRSSGQASEAEAQAAWMRSPAHRRFLVSGAIQDIACVGGVCVGRSVQAVQANIAAPFMQGVSSGLKSINHRAPLKRIRNHFSRCR